MDAFGFYKVEDGALDAGEFVAANIIGICRELCPEKTPDVFFVDENFMQSTSIISYDPHFTGLFDLPTGEQRYVSNAFAFCPKKLFEEYEPIMNNYAALFLALWQAVLHEVRHFVQHQCFQEGEWMSLLLTKAVLEEIARRNPVAAQSAYNHIENYAHVTDPERLAKELDAIIVGLIAGSILAASCDGFSFDFAKVRGALMCSMQEDISCLLDVFSMTAYS